jgi:hypothetical protein
MRRASTRHQEEGERSGLIHGVVADLEECHHGGMAISYEQALQVQSENQDRLMALEGVSAVGAKLGEDGPVLEVTLDPDAALPQGLDASEIDGVPLRVVRGRYTLQ